MTHDAESGQTPDDVTALLASAAAGDGSAWVTLVERYGRRVYALASSRTRSHDAAEEITQSVFVTVAEKVGQNEYTERGRFEPWLFRIAMNRIRDHIRRVRREPSVRIVGDEATVAQISHDARLGAGAGSGCGGAVDAVATDEHARREVDALRRAMDRLSDPDREVIELRHHASLSFKQIADLLGEPLGTLLARHHRALKKLREHIEQGSESGVDVGGLGGRGAPLGEATRREEPTVGASVGHREASSGRIP